MLTVMLKKGEKAKIYRSKQKLIYILWKYFSQVDFRP